MASAAQSPSAYANIMVPVDLSSETSNRVRLATGLADRFSSRLIGVAARPLYAPLYFENPSEGVPGMMELEEKMAAEKIAEAKAAFRQMVGACRQVDWRQTFDSPNDFVLEQARAADLIIVGCPGEGTAAPNSMSVNGANIVMDAGRPVLFVPPGTDDLSGNRIVIGWKDTREARRAVWDSLGFLKRAEEVFVVAEQKSSADDVVAYLGRHDIDAISIDGLNPELSTAESLIRTAQREKADMIVCGAYGHSRTREWVFGGVTRELLDHSPLCCLMAH